MAARGVMSSPLTLYVLWHPKSNDGEALAHAAYRWFHAPSDDLLRAGLGLPVYFRSQPATEERSLPRSIDVEASDFNVVVVLADANLVGDPEWANWVGELARRTDRVLMVPVALHESAYRLPESLRRLNFLRVDDRADSAADASVRLVRRSSRLLRQLAEVIGRELMLRLAESSGLDGRAPPPMTVFLSHAKRDGVVVAEALRSAVQNQNRLRAFLDDTDLPVGHAFANELRHAAGTDSAAMIAIVSDAYAARPWCRREVELARLPRAEPGHPRCWANRPLVVVDCLDHAPTRNIPELGNATVVRWQADRALEIVDLLMLEVVLNSFHRLQARRVPSSPDRHVIAWTPDATSLLALRREVKEPIQEIVHPGRALPEAEALTLQGLFPDIRLRTFEDVASTSRSTKRVAVGRVVGLSIGVHPGLGSLGLGGQHIEEIALRAARCVVESGGRLAFGGMLGSSGLTETLLMLVRTLSTDDDSDLATDPVPRIVCYQRWPSLPSAEQIAADVGIADYVLIGSGLPASEQVQHDPRIRSPERARQDAYALSSVRHAMSSSQHRSAAGRLAPKLDARIVIGGLRTDFNGFMPGILEEALYAFEAEQPVFLLGGFGGAAALLAEAIDGEILPPELEPDFHRRGSARFRRLEQGLANHNETDEIDRRFDRLWNVIVRVRGDLVAGLRNGLDAAENRRLFQSDHVAEIVDLLRRGMSNLWPESR